MHETQYIDVEDLLHVAFIKKLELCIYDTSNDSGEICFIAENSSAPDMLPILLYDFEDDKLDGSKIPIKTEYGSDPRQ